MCRLFPRIPQVTIIHGQNETHLTSRLQANLKVTVTFQHTRANKLTSQHQATMSNKNGCLSDLQDASFRASSDRLNGTMSLQSLLGARRPYPVSPINDRVPSLASRSPLTQQEDRLRFLADVLTMAIAISDETTFGHDEDDYIDEMRGDHVQEEQ
jgi:hypothetical protein